VTAGAAKKPALGAGFSRLTRLAQKPADFGIGSGVAPRVGSTEGPAAGGTTAPGANITGGPITAGVGAEGP